MRERHLPHRTNFTPAVGLHQLAQQRAPVYAAAAPFPHTYIDHLFWPSTVEAIAAELPEEMTSQGCVPGAANCYRKPGTTRTPHLPSAHDSDESRRIASCA